MNSSDFSCSSRTLPHSHRHWSPRCSSRRSCRPRSCDWSRAAPTLPPPASSSAAVPPKTSAAAWLRFSSSGTPALASEARTRSASQRTPAMDWYSCHSRYLRLAERSLELRLVGALLLHVLAMELLHLGRRPAARPTSWGSCFPSSASAVPPACRTTGRLARRSGRDPLPRSDWSASVPFSAAPASLRDSRDRASAHADVPCSPSSAHACVPDRAPAWA